MQKMAVDYAQLVIDQEWGLMSNGQHLEAARIGGRHHESRSRLGAGQRE